MYSGGKGECTDKINLSCISDRGRLTFLSVAQRFSLSPEIQTQISSLQNTQADCEEGTHYLRGEVSLGLMLYLVPGHWFRPEERACELYRETFLVVLGFVL